MPDIKDYSTGRLGNDWPRHPNTDHVNTKGLDPEGRPGIEAYIDEDIVRAYDDNRPIANLVYNDEMLAFTQDKDAQAFDINGYIKTSRQDWDIQVGEQAYFTDPEDFTRQTQITPLRVSKGVGYLPGSGYVTNTSKVIIGFQRSDGTTLYVQENIWYDDNTPIFDDPSSTYSGFYRPIYSGVAESKLPADYNTYQITLRQINTTGNVYTYPIFTDQDFLIPFTSSIFNVENEATSFLSDSQYPGYDYYPNTFAQLTANNMGTLEVSEDSEVIKNIKREGHKLTANDFLLDGGSYKAELTADAFRENKSASLNRIENDVNFIRIITGVKQYNNSSKVYFKDHKNILNALVPLDTERDFLGDQDYLFAVTIEDQLNEEPQILELHSPQTRGYQEFGLSVANPSTALGLTAGTYNHSIQINNDSTPLVAQVTVANSDNLYDVAEKMHQAFMAHSPEIRAFPVVVESGGNYDIRVYSKSAGDYSKVLQNLTGSSDLRSAFTLFPGGFEAAVDASTWSETRWEFGQWPIYQDPSMTGDFRSIRSAGVTTQNDFEVGTVGRAIFDEMVARGFDDFTVGINIDLTSGHNTELYILANGSTQGYQNLNMSVPNPSVDSGLDPLSAYYFQLNINGEGLQEFVLNTTTDVSYQGVVNALNTALSGLATVSFTPANDIQISSDAFGPDSSIETDDGITGTSLFGFAYPAAGFTPVSQHANPVTGFGKRVKVFANKINDFAIFEDTVYERAVFTHGQSKIYITPNTETDIRDHIDTEHAYITRTSEGRWSTQADRTITIDMSAHASWTGSYITKIYQFSANSNNYLVLANDIGQIFFYENGQLYNNYLIADDFTLLTDGDLGTNNEEVNNFFVFEDTVNSKLYLFVMTETYVYYSDVTSGLVAAQSFTSVDTSSSLDVPNVSMPIFSQINDAVDWEANVNTSNSNNYIVFVGKSDPTSSWAFAPILYALFNSGTEAFSWYAEDRYWRTQIDDIPAIVKYNGWEDPEQSYQLFIGNNANGPELWTGNSQNNTTDIGGAGDDRFNRFSWIETNLENGNPLAIDNDITRINDLVVYDNRIFITSQRSSEDVLGGLFSFAANDLQPYFKRSGTQMYVHPSGDAMFLHLYDDLPANGDPAIAKLFTERSDGRAIVYSNDNLLSVSGWPTDSSFRITLEGFDVGGIIYDGEYDVVFDGNQSNIFDIVDYINGVQTTVGIPAGLSDSFVVTSGISGFDLTPVVRARVVTNIEKSGNTYQTFYKIAIESKTSDPTEASGHSNPSEVTQSNCTITISHPTQGTTVVGTGSNTLGIPTGTSATANLQLTDWSDANLYQLKRVNTAGLSFGGSTFIDITPQIQTGYSVLPGSLRVKANSTDELGFNQGRGRIIEAATATGLANDSTVYSFKVTFDEDLTPAGTVEITDVTTPADSGGSLDGTYWELYASITSSPTTDYYVWYNVEGLSTDPAPVGKTGIEVRIVQNDADSVVAFATADAINAVPGFSASSSGNVVTVTNNGVGSVTDAVDVTAGVGVSVTQQGVDPGYTVEWVDVVGSSAQTMADLITEINNDLTSGAAALEPLGGTAEYVDVVVTSNLIGDDSSVRIESSPFDIYLFGYNGLDTIPNSPVQGSTALNTAGSQTVGFTWENTDYFIEENHPGTGEIRLYIPNGNTRISTGTTVWLDFWQYKELTKITADGTAPNSGEWTYDLDKKRIVIGEAPTTSAPEDIFFVDLRASKRLSKLDLTTTIPSSQTDLSDRFHATGPNDLENSDISLARPLARVSALHYGTFTWGTDDQDPVSSTYSFFLPRLDLVAIRKDVGSQGSRAFFIKGTPNPDAPYINLPLVDQDKESYLYATFVSSQNFFNNNITLEPWARNAFEETERIYLGKDCQWFVPENALVSTKGLRTRSGCSGLSKQSENNRYALVKTIDPLGIREPLKRRGLPRVDNSKIIFVNAANGSNNNDGWTPDSPVATLANAISKASSARPYIMIIPTVQLNKDSYAAITINRNFKVYIIAEHQIAIPSATISSEVYLEGIEIQGNLTLLPGHDVEVKYCNIGQIVTDGTLAYPDGIHLSVENSVITNDAFVVSGSGSHNITGPVDVEFNHVYIKDSANLLTFNPDSYDDTLQNTFIFNHVTNSLAGTEYIISTPYNNGITIQINNSLLPSASSTVFDSGATVTLNKTISYVTSNNQPGAIISIDSQNVNPGEIDIVAELGAPISIPRGYDENSVALDYIENHIDAGAYIERRFVNEFVDDLEIIGNTKSFIKASEDRFSYQDFLKPDRFAFFMKLKPQGNFQETGVIFDSRYAGDFNADAGLFNVNASDFIQIVYDNKTYGTNYLTTDKYCFKFIMSNNTVTNVAVIGPYFTIEDHEEFNNWHEIGVQFSYQNTYTPKYESALLGTLDEDRKQFVIHTTFDRDLSRVYALRDNPFEDQDGNLIPTSRWLPGASLSEYFNIAGGWTADWIMTTGGQTWTTWTPDKFNMLIDNYLVTTSEFPVNALLNLGTKTVIDPYATDYYEPAKESRDASIINHCQNPHPYSENGVEPAESAFVSFRQYEGWEHHALAVETQSENLLIGGKFLVGDWFDRTNADKYNSTETTTWDSAIGDADGEIAVLKEDAGGNLDLVFLDVDNNVTATASILSGETITETKVKRIGTRYLVGYIPSDNSLTFKLVDASTKIVSSAVTVSSDTINEFNFDRGHSNSQFVFTYWNATTGASYITVVSDAGATVYGPVDFNAGVHAIESFVIETQDSNGDNGYYIFYREDGTDLLRFVMYQEDLAGTYVANDTLISGQVPTQLKSIRLLNNNALIKWLDATGSAPYEVNFAVIAPDGTDLVLQTQLTADATGIARAQDIVLRQDNLLLFANRQYSDDEIEFHLYQQDGTELDNSPFLRNYNEQPITGRVLITRRAGSTNQVITTTVDELGTNVGAVIELDTQVPIRWYKDFTGIFDEFEVSTYRTQSLFGYALTQRFNHATSPGEGSIITAQFVADAETPGLGEWVNRVQTNGAFAGSTDDPAHGDRNYEISYDGTGSVVYANKPGITGLTGDGYARFYVKLDKFFSLTGSTPALEIAKFGPQSDPVTVEIVYNDPVTGGDGKYKLRATHSIAGTDTTASSVIDYLVYQYVDIRYNNDVSGGFQVWVDGSMVIDQTGVDTTASGDADFIQIGSSAGNTPSNGSILYFDDIRVDTGFIGEYTIGLGQSDVWQPTSIVNAGNKHYVSGYYLLLSGNWILRLEGPALNNPIEILFNIPGRPEHVTKGTDTVTDIACRLINWDKVRRFEVGFVPDNPGDIEVHILSTNSDDGDRVDDFLVDNVKLEENEYPSSIDSDQNGYVEFPSTLDSLGNLFMRVRPEFRYDTPVDHYLASAPAEAEDQSTFNTHQLWYDATDRRFKFMIANEYGDSIVVQSDVYGDASSTQQLTDLNEEHHIVCNWDNSLGYVEMFIDKRWYRTEGTPIPSLKRSAATIVGNNYDRARPADTIFDLFRFGEETLAHRAIFDAMGKMDPFFHPNAMNIGKSSVAALSFFGIQPPDEYTIYSVPTDGGSHDLVIEVGEDFADRIVMRHDGDDVAHFTANGLQVFGSLQTQFLIAEQTTTLTTTDDHITLRFGFAGVPPTTNDGYFEVERGNFVNSEIRWDESMDSWTVKDGINNRIAINGTQIGTWKNDEHFNLVTDGIGTIRMHTDTTTDGGTGDGSANRTPGTLRMEVGPTRTKVWDDFVVFGRAARVAIGTETHEFRLTIDDDGGIIARGNHGAGVTLTTSGPGSRMIWYPRKSTFRAGNVSGTQWDDTNVGNYSMALGRDVRATAESSIAIGSSSSAIGLRSVAIGYSGTATGESAIALGASTASGVRSLAWGNAAGTTIAASDSIALGASSSATQPFATAIGQLATASASDAVSIGRDNTASGIRSIAMGFTSQSSGTHSVAIGQAAIASASDAVSIGRDNTASTEGSVALGRSTTSSGLQSFTAGYLSQASGSRAAAVGESTTASGAASFAAGLSSQAIGNRSLAVGDNATANGEASVALGYGTTASNIASTSLGYNTTVNGQGSIAAGTSLVVTAFASAAFGTGNSITGQGSITAGSGNSVSSSYGAAFNQNTTVTGTDATAFGINTEAQAYASVVIGRYNVIAGNAGSWVATDPLFVIGNGTNSGSRNNAFTVFKNGNATLDGIFTADSLDISGSLDFFIRADDDGSGNGFDVLGSTIIDIGATDPISTTRSASNINITHDDSGVVAASYGSATAIPNFTVNATGHIVSAGSTAIAARVVVAPGPDATTGFANTIMLRDAAGRAQTRIPTSQPSYIANGDIWVV